MTAALEGDEWSASRPGRTLPPGKTRYPFYRSLGGPQGRSGRAENLIPTGIRSRIVQPIPSRNVHNLLDEFHKLRDLQSQRNTVYTNNLVLLLQIF